MIHQNQFGSTTIRPLLLKILFFIYLTSAYLNATHMHIDELEHDHECEVCLLVKHFQSSDIPKPDLQLPALESYKLELKPTQHYHLTPMSIGFNATAPPLC